MEEDGFDYAAVLPIATKPERVDRINAWVYEICKKYPQFIPFATIHPACEDYRSKLIELKRQGFLGVKLHPLLQTDSPMSPLLEEKWLNLIQTIEDIGLVVLTCTFFPGEVENQTAGVVKDIKEIIKMFPRLRLIAAHMGASLNWDSARRELLGENIYLDLSYVLGNLEDDFLVDMIREHGADKILFGTDSPYHDPEVAFRRFEALSLSGDEKEPILCKNAQRLLGIEQELNLYKITCEKCGRDFYLKSELPCGRKFPCPYCRWSYPGGDCGD